MAMTPGIVPALNYCVRAFSRPGDPVIVQPPVYHPFYYAIENNGRRIVRNPLRLDGGRYTMDLDDLRTKIDAPGRMLILCSPHNPVGRVWTRDELEALGRIAVERDLLVVADEIHHDLVYQGHRHHVFASLAPELAQQTITCIAPSKTFNTAGLSTAAVVAPNPDLLKKFEDEAERSGFDLGNALGIVAFEAAYAHGEEWLEALLPYLEANVDFLQRFLEERIPRLRLVRPEGTYLALIDCRGLGMDPARLNDFFLKQTRVYFSDGKIFGDEAAGFVRINFGCPRSVLREALERIERAVKELSR
jgi:cystathionine beta-lyase